MRREEKQETPPDREFDALLRDYLAGGMDPEALTALERRLLEDERAREEYWNVAGVHAELAWRYTRDSPVLHEGEHFLLKYASGAAAGLGLVAGGPVDVRPFTSAERRFARPLGETQRAIAQRFVGLVLAAVLLFAAAPTLMRYVGGAFGAANGVGFDPSTRYVATVAERDRCVWGRNDLRGHRRLEVGRQIELLSGKAVITFDSGGHVVVYGPASLEITSPETAELRSGKLVAEAPLDSDLRLATPHARSVNASRHLAITADAASTTICSFRGEASVLPATSVTTAAHVLGEGASATIDGRGRLVTSEPFASVDYPPVDPLQNIIRYIQGPIAFHDIAPTSLGPFSLESDDVVHLLPERQGVEIATTVSATFVEPGSHGRYLTPFPKLPVGETVDSYLLHFNPRGQKRYDPDKDDDYPVQEGEIRFTREIVGVICDSGQLERSDEVFGAEQTTYFSAAVLADEEVLHINRGVWRNNLKWHERDCSLGQFVEISEDRRTLRFRFVVTGPGSDQIRIIVKSRSLDRTAAAIGPRACQRAEAGRRFDVFPHSTVIASIGHTKT